MNATGAAQYLRAFQRIPGCVQRLLLCGTAAPGLIRLMPPTVPAEAVAEPGAATTGAGVPDAAFLALLPGELAAIPRWAAWLEKVLPGDGFIMAVGVGTDDALLAHLSPAFAPYVEEPLEDGVVFRLYVRKDYNPIAHAASAGERSDFAAAYEILCLVPDTYLRASRTAAEMHGARLGLVHAWARQGGVEASAALTKGHAHFFQALAADPTCPDAYEALAALWDWCGDGRRSLSVTAFHRQVYGGALDAGPPVPALGRVEAAGVAGEAVSGRVGKVLFVSHPRVHYGLDVLYDGLVQVLGHDQVDIYPYKPSLHGGAPPEHAHYPCSFHHPAPARDLEGICGALQSGDYDCILWGDSEWGLDDATVGRIMESAGETPVWIVDQADECVNLRGLVEQRLGRRAAGYFKREKVATVDYGPGSHPLPFAYPASRVGAVGQGRSGLFWAGQRRFGMRRPILEYLETVLGAPLDGQYSQEAYRARLAEAAVGLNLSGAGFDTVRYWELPAHGVLLLTERLPIAIPDDFRDGEDALVFDTPRECAERLAWALAHPDAVQEMASRALARFERCHTGAARARQLLETVAAAGKGTAGT